MLCFDDEEVELFGKINRNVLHIHDMCYKILRWESGKIYAKLI
jgi:hypothetical protein